MIEPLSLEELHSLLKPYNWDDFEATQDGYLPIAQQPADPEGISFYMRVGLHMKRPMQVIIAEGNFVRMRAEKRWPEWQPQFKTIDPKNPKESLYKKISVTYQVQQHTYASGGPYKDPAELDKEWCPAVLYANTLYGGAGGGSAISTLYAGSQQMLYPGTMVPNTYTGTGYITNYTSYGGNGGYSGGTGGSGYATSGLVNVSQTQYQQLLGQAQYQPQNTQSGGGSGGLLGGIAGLVNTLFGSGTTKI